MKVSCYLGNMHTVPKLDLGFGDVIYPKPVEMDYLEILNKKGFRIYAYSLESVIAEKFEAMIVLDALNSRMTSLTEAIKGTFHIGRTVLPENPAIFSKYFVENPRNHDLWKAFLKRIKAEDISFDVVLIEITNNLEPIYITLCQEA